jgi:hypothetical protein
MTKLWNSLTLKNLGLLTVIISGLAGILLVLIGFNIILEPLDSYTRYASNTITLTIDDSKLEAQVLCNFTSEEGFFCQQPINVSAIVIHELPPQARLTRLVFLESTDYPVKFFEIKNDSNVYVPDGGSIGLEYSHSFIREGKTNYVYEGDGRIFYDYEGQFTTTLQFEPDGQAVYQHENVTFIRPTLVVRTQAEFQQIKDSQAVLGLTWIAAGLTIWTIIFAVIEIRYKVV